MILKARALTCGFLLLATLPAQTAATAVRKPVAIVYQMKGDALRIEPGRSRERVHLFDRLPAGTTLEVAPSSRLALAFVNGLRYELGEGSRATLGPKDFASHTGVTRPLAPVPPLPCLSPIAAKDRPGLRAGAVRIRGERITGLYPRRGAAVLAGEAVLRFQPAAGARGYRIEVQDGEGWTVFQADAESPPVKVPGRLRTGHRYWWTVQTLDRPSAVARGGAELVTLGADAARMREEARKVLEAEGPGSLPLLAEVDRSLGLLHEAREDLRTALESTPSGPALREALAELEMQLEDKDDHD
jgi:hypothetical protein